MAAQKGAEDDDSLFPPPPKKVTLSSAPQFLVGVQLGKGGFGQVFKGSRAYPRATKDPSKPMQVAIKFEHTSSKGLTSKGVPYEWEVYTQLGETPGVPRLLHKGFQDGFCIMIMELLGQSLWDVCNVPSRNCLSEGYVACVAIEALAILQGMHEKGYVHGDVKPENLCLGADCNGAQHRLFLLDLGLASRWRFLRTPASYSQRPDDFRGTIRYASVHAHLGRAVSRRDDLESLAYTLLFLLDGELPWQGFTGDNKGFLVARQKVYTTVEHLCRFHSAPFQQFLEYVLALPFLEAPQYQLCQQLFEPLLEEPSQRPLARTYVSAAQAKVGSKRGRSPEADPAARLMVDAEGKTRKRLRISYPAPQFLTIYNHRQTLKQRYHYNVSSQRLDTHINYGSTDNLSISSVATYNNLWAVVMDCDPAVASQRYLLASSQGTDPNMAATELLPKAWITDQWNQGFFITALAGSQDGQVLVVMTKLHRPFQQQSYKVSSQFPSEWVRRKRRDNFHVTVVGTIGSRTSYHWVVVVTSGTTFAQQIVELDFVYPSEAIHLYWDQGYRITSVACSPDQTAVVLTTGAFAGKQEAPQETLRTTSFPAHHIKEKWDKDLYIGSVAWGPMVN